MALSFPYALAFLSDRLCGADAVHLDLLRKDELSGSGDGRIWAAQLARPIWSVSLAIEAEGREKAREIDAKIRALDGSRQSFLWADKFYRPSGPIAGAVSVSAVGADRTSLALSGLPAGYKVRVGDKFSVAFGSSVYFAEFIEAKTASGAGAVTQTAVFPYVPFGVLAGAAVEMTRPYIRMIVQPGGHVPFMTRRGRWSRQSSLQLLQKV